MRRPLAPKSIFAQPSYVVRIFLAFCRPSGQFFATSYIFSLFRALRADFSLFFAFSRPSGPFFASWGPLAGLLGPLGRLLGASWGLFMASWGPLGPSWGPLGALLGAFWALLGASWGPLGPSWGPLGGTLGGSWALLGASSRSTPPPTPPPTRQFPPKRRKSPLKFVVIYEDFWLTNRKCDFSQSPLFYQGFFRSEGVLGSLLGASWGHPGAS